MKWIPCKERLPETPVEYSQKKNYLCCFKEGYMATLSWWDGWNCSMNYNGTISNEHEITDVIAWMELPKPYKEPEMAEVVRCVDCKYYADNCDDLELCKWRSDEMPDEDDFCSCGERKGGDAE